jgi:hypothetical protein
MASKMSLNVPANIGFSFELIKRELHKKIQKLTTKDVVFQHHA